MKQLLANEDSPHWLTLGHVHMVHAFKFSIKRTIPIVAKHKKNEGLKLSMYPMHVCACECALCIIIV